MDIHINRIESRVLLEIIDDGVGSEGQGYGGFGLISIRERVEILGGEFNQINSLEGAAHLSVKVQLPSPNLIGRINTISIIGKSIPAY
mgnify:CR=1 FL=1